MDTNEANLLIIATNPYKSYQYSKYYLFGKRFKLGEKAILNSSFYGINYINRTGYFPKFKFVNRNLIASLRYLPYRIIPLEKFVSINNIYYLNKYKPVYPTFKIKSMKFFVNSLC